MNASVPESASRPMPPGCAFARGRLGRGEIRHVVAGPLRAVPPTHFLRSLHGLPDGSADARLYSSRRLAGHAKPQFRCAPRLARRIGFLARREILIGRREHARVDPRRARRRAIVFETRRSRRGGGAGSAAVVAVHLLEELVRHRARRSRVPSGPRARSRTSGVLNPWSRGAWLSAYSFLRRLPSW